MDNTLIDSPVVGALHRRIADLEAENARTYGVIARLRTLCGDAANIWRRSAEETSEWDEIVRLDRASKGEV